MEKEMPNTPQPVEDRIREAIVVGPSYHFWLNEEDEIYDKLHREKV